MHNVREEIANRIAWISLFSNIALMLGKLISGSAGNSSAVFADGIHSAADVVASIVVLLVIKIANKPADEEHPYGHGKAEIIISGLVGILLFLVCLYLVYEIIIGFLHPVTRPGLLPLWIAVVSYVAKTLLYRYSLEFSKKYSSKAIEAIALDHKADIIASLAAVVGVFSSIIGAHYNIHFLMYGDRIATVFVVYLIFRIAKEMLTEAWDILLERNVDQELLNEYIAVIETFEDVKRIDRIRAREHGHYILVDVRMSIDHNKTIKFGHDLGREIKRTLMGKYDNIDEVLIHLNPYFEEDK
ncbi:cation diffusion facilitator family transporter [Priestia filamentosa]|uniref:cation diffusion facilitator family transporter n=1 Tax=Priestia filamentosa TaxID=1402861 RepID=UPI0005895C6B